MHISPHHHPHASSPSKSINHRSLKTQVWGAVSHPRMTRHTWKQAVEGEWGWKIRYREPSSRGKGKRISPLIKDQLFVSHLTRAPPRKANKQTLAWRETWNREEVSHIRQYWILSTLSLRVTTHHRCVCQHKLWLDAISLRSWVTCGLKREGGPKPGHLPSVDFQAWGLAPEDPPLLGL